MIGGVHTFKGGAELRVQNIDSLTSYDIKF